ncbi:hypothetical protein KEM48_012728 [Puccinia striiformis f. sp. tritici PST-130]|nr:hypothetical protein KEM48_012728 [Puccinia striiformis f. sp. tritici PST-130]
MANTQLTAGSAAMDNNQTNSAPASAVSPKGILKNKLGQQESRSPHLAHGLIEVRWGSVEDTRVPGSVYEDTGKRVED